LLGKNNSCGESPVGVETVRQLEKM